MASKLSQLPSAAVGQLQSAITQGSKFVAKNGPTYYKQLLENTPVYYKQLLEKNKKYIQDPPTVDTCKLLSEQLLFTRLASIPSRYEAFWKELDSMKELWKMRNQFKLEDYGIAALFGVECYAWSFAGEVIGRGFTFTGYYV